MTVMLFSPVKLRCDLTGVVVSLGFSKFETPAKNTPPPAHQAGTSSSRGKPASASAEFAVNRSDPKSAAVRSKKSRDQDDQQNGDSTDGEEQVNNAASAASAGARYEHHREDAYALSGPYSSNGSSSKLKRKLLESSDEDD
jgi:hypothetical protein